MASPEKVVIVAFFSLLLLSSTAIYAKTPEAWDQISEKYNAAIAENHEAFKSLDDQSSWTQRTGASALVRLNDLWDGVVMATSFMWLLCSAPFKLVFTSNSWATTAEQMLLNGLRIVSMGLILIIGVNVYLIFFNKKT